MLILVLEADFLQVNFYRFLASFSLCSKPCLRWIWSPLSHAQDCTVASGDRVSLFHSDRSLKKCLLAISYINKQADISPGLQL